MKRLFLILLSLFFASHLASGQTSEVSGGAGRRSPDSPETKSYVNKAEGLNDPVRESFVGFSLDYPASWESARGTSPDADYFVQLKRSQPGAPIEQEFAVIIQFTVNTSCVLLDDPKMKDLFSELMAQKFKSLSNSFITLEKVDERRITIGKYDAYELRFSGLPVDKGAEKIPVWGRFILIPGVMRVKEGMRGVAILMFASALAPEIKGIEDVGVKGGLRVVLDSFRLSPPNASNRPEIKNFRLVEMYLVTDAGHVGQTNESVAQTAEFKSKSPITYLWNVEGAKPGMVFKVVWVEDKGGRPGERVIYEKEEVMKGDGPCTADYQKSVSQTRSPGWPSGKYRFELYADGQLLKSLPFIIKK